MDADLKLYIGSTEYGTEVNPIVFSGALAGSITEHPLNPFYLWNDKSGVLDSVPAKTIEIQLLDMWIQSELLGVSNGTAGQTFSCSVPPLVDTGDTEEIQIKVGTVDWSRVGSFTGTSPSALVYTINPTTGLVTFGNSVNGMIPPTGENITITYMPDLPAYGNSITDGTWFEVKSLGCTTNPVTVIDEQKTSFDTTHVYTANIQVSSISGVWLQSDPSHSGTNYYTSGSFVASTGLITLGTALPSDTTPVLIDYIHTTIDDVEADYTPIGDTISHTFTNQIGKNNAKLLFFRLNVPSDANPSGGGNLNFRIRLRYRQ